MAIIHCLAIITLDVNGINVPIKGHRLAEWIKKNKRPVHMLLTGTHYRSKTYTQTELNQFLKTIFYANGNKNKARVAGLISKK